MGDEAAHDLGANVRQIDEMDECGVGSMVGDRVQSSTQRGPHSCFPIRGLDEGDGFGFEEQASLSGCRTDDDDCFGAAARREGPCGTDHPGNAVATLDESFRHTHPPARAGRQ